MIMALDKTNVWRVDTENNNFLVSPYSSVNSDKLIKPAQPFTLRLRHCQIFQDGLDRDDGNDILITTRTTVGEDRPDVDCINFWQENIEPGQFISDIEYNNMYVTDDYSGDDVRLSINVIEVNTVDNERDQITANLGSLFDEFGAVFPVLMPYVTPGRVVLKTIKKLFDLLQKDTTVIKVNFRLQKFNPDSSPSPGDAPLQAGKYVVFRTDFQGKALMMADDGKIVTRPGGDLGATSIPCYVVFEVVPETRVAPKMVIGQKMATLMSQLELGNPNSTQKSLDFIKETLQAYKTIKDLERYRELKLTGQANLTPEEQQRLTELKANLGQFLS